MEDRSERLERLLPLVCGMATDPHVRDDTPDGSGASKVTPARREAALAVPETNVQNMLSSNMSPMTRLKEALSGEEAFTKHYLVSWGLSFYLYFFFAKHYLVSCVLFVVLTSSRNGFCSCCC